MGRDHYVRVVYAGFLVPFGHRASVIKITERQFHADRPGNAAYLRQRMFLVVREQVKTYRTTGLRYDGPDATRTGEQYDLMMPFEAVRILTLRLAAARQARERTTSTTRNRARSGPGWEASPSSST